MESGTRLRLEHTSPSTVTAAFDPVVGARSVTSTLWCGAAIKLAGLLAGRFMMGRAVPANSGEPVRAVSVDRAHERTVGVVQCG